MIFQKYCRNSRARRNSSAPHSDMILSRKWGKNVVVGLSWRRLPLSRQNHVAVRGGIILIDILLALSLGVIFIAIITSAAIDSRQLYESAKNRVELINSYLSGNYRSSTRLFGNERTETIYATSTMQFDFVSAVSPMTNPADYAGTPLCSVDFANHTVIGSYDYFHPTIAISSATTTLNIPQALIKQIPLPISPGIPLTDLEVRNGVAYISTDSAVSADPDIFIVDISDKSSPKLLASINTGPGIASIALAGRRIYAAAASITGQLQIIRMDKLNYTAAPTLTLESKFKLPLPYATATEPIASSVFYNRQKIYLGTEKWDGDEFSIIDVSNPTKPIKIGGFEIGSKVNDLYVQGGIAYVAGADQNQLRLIDVRNPSQPILLNSFSPSGWQRQEGRAVSIFEGGLDFARTSGGYDIPTDAEAFAWASTSSLFLTDPSLLNIPGGVYGIVADRLHLFLATRETNKELQIFDRVLTASTSISYSLPISPETITCDANHLYILSHSSPTIYEITF